jgi:hypothetical protein
MSMSIYSSASIAENPMLPAALFCQPSEHMLNRI